MTNKDTTKDFTVALQDIRNNASSTAEKGRWFEKLMVGYFEKDPVYKERFEWVRRWDVKLDGDRDLGIDLLAKEKMGGMCAIQCKCYEDDAPLSKKAIDSFIAAANPTNYQSRIFVTTATKHTDNLVKMTKGQMPPIQILTPADLSRSRIQWPLMSKSAGRIKYIGEKYKPRPHQQKAIDEVASALMTTNDRGKMIMACGTGKTFTALRIAERIAGKNGRVLYLVPSISLIQQSLREWVEQKSNTISQSYIAICSDTQAGKTDENENLFELEIPVTTNPEKISAVLKIDRPDTMQVVFCTYQSIDLVKKAQDAGAAEFDITFADEAHRTTGLEELEPKENQEPSTFVRIHDEGYIKTKRRLYMTATPKVYANAQKRKAGQRQYQLFSMDDELVYGPELFKLDFPDAIEKNLLSDFKVLMIHVDENYAAKILDDRNIITMGGEGVALTLEDAAKVIGTAKALSFPERNSDGKPKSGQRALTRAISFCNTIKYSRTIEKFFKATIDSLKKGVGGLTEEYGSLNFAVHHVDGKTNALNRKGEIDWLKHGEENDKDDICRILSNARCLTEGIDVPALDAAYFYHPKSSYIDIIQAVGRVMRKTSGKKYGYIVLPMLIPGNTTDIQELIDKNKNYAVAWRVLKALRSHNEQFGNEINTLRFDDDSDNSGARITQVFVDENGNSATIGSEKGEQLNIPFNQVEFLNAIHIKMIEEVGDRYYWENWSEDVSNIAKANISRITELLKNTATRVEFDKFLKALQEVVSPELKEEDAISMLSQHLITQPVFEALFQEYDFASNNPVSKALEKIIDVLHQKGLEAELKDLEAFYESVRSRAEGVTDPLQRQDLIKELYENFFRNAFPDDAEKFGVVYTPIEIIDFILNSANDVSVKEFGRGLTEAGVDIIDPFSGTGTFITRLIQSNIIKNEDLDRKFKNELHANEIMLLAYYMSAINIEEAYHSRKLSASYESFDGIVLRDTFTSYTENWRNKNRDEQDVLPDYFPVNNERANKQDKTDIRIVVGNPPWRIGQAKSTDKNPNLKYKNMNKRITDTYAKRSTAKAKNGLQDSYIKAIRWASDRIGNEGIIAFVTNSGWLTGIVTDGLRACLAEEFSSIYCFDLKGKLMKKGDGENVFGVKVPVAITIFVKNLQDTKEKCDIYYKDIGNNLNQTEKLKRIGNFKSVGGIKSWEKIFPDIYNDWLEQRNPSYQQYYPIGNWDTKKDLSSSGIFKLYSRGIETNRDEWAYNSSAEILKNRANQAVKFYNKQIEENKIIDPDENRELIKWHGKIKKKLRIKNRVIFEEESIRYAIYRPFYPQFIHYDPVFNNTHNQLDKIFPNPKNKIPVINTTGKSASSFSSIMVAPPPRP